MQQISDISIVTLQRTDQIVVYMREEPNMTPINPQMTKTATRSRWVQNFSCFAAVICTGFASTNFWYRQFGKVFAGNMHNHAHWCKAQGWKVRCRKPELGGKTRIDDNWRHGSGPYPSLLATSVDGIDRYQAKDTIWKISVRWDMMTVCQENEEKDWGGWRWYRDHELATASRQCSRGRCVEENTLITWLQLGSC